MVLQYRLFKATLQFLMQDIFLQPAILDIHYTRSVRVSTSTFKTAQLNRRKTYLERRVSHVK